MHEEVEILTSDTTEDLLDRMSHLAGNRIMDVVEGIRKGVKPTAQSTAGITLAPKISKEMAKIDWREGADSILRKVRALGERPGVWSTFKGERVALHVIKESLLPNTLKKVGEIEVVEGQLLIRCSDSVLTIAELTPAGKKRMSGGDFARGVRLEPGERFE